MEAQFQGVIDDLRGKFKDDTEIEELVKNIEAEYVNSDLKGKVILKQMLVNLLTDMEKVDTETSNSNRTGRSRLTAIFRGDGGGGSSKSSPNVATLDKMKKGLEGVKHKAEYLKDRKKEEPMGESVKELIGREKEKEDIIDQLVLLSRSGDSPVPVIAISGLAGIGKTKLARHVFEDEKFQKKVGFPVWVHADDTPIYDTWGADFIEKVIGSVEQVKTATESLRPTTDLNIIVILDNWRVCIEEKDVKEFREKIEGMDLNNAVPRVRAIIITTRNSLLVRDIGDIPVKSYPLAGLDGKESELLFEKARGGDAGNKVRTEMLMRQCRGVPLAIIAMAGCRRDSSRPRELTLEEQLMYSYYEVGEGFPHQCFAYFSLFPLDFLFDAERLIHLWMAEGFLDSEKTARRYFRDMVGRSMFQDVKEDEFGEVRSFKLHPLMHDVARLVVDRENITMDPTGHKVHSKIKRVSFDLSFDFSRGIPSSLFDKQIPLTSIFFFANTKSRLPMQLDLSTTVLEIFKTFKKLCVLDLRDLEIVVVPGSIGDLKDLVYLDLSQNNMEKLPKSITKLSKIQTLKLAHCYSLKELPKGFEKLSQLKHLDMEGCLNGLTSVNLEKLTSLQTLSAIVALNNYFNNPNLDVLGLAEINNLKQLQIRCTMSSEEIDRHLTLTWHPDPNLGVGEKKKTKGSRECALGELILVGTRSCQVEASSGSTDTSGQTHNSQVKASSGSTDTSGQTHNSQVKAILLTWKFNCLVKLSLQDCSQCEFLSEKDELPKLKILELVRLDKLEYVSKEYVEGADFYKTLKELTISDCPNLKCWWKTDIEKDHRPVFDSISKLHVHHCPDLTFMPLYPRLESCTSSSFGKELVLENSSSKLLLDTRSTNANYSIALEHLYIQNCNDLDDLCSAFQQLSSLQSLTVENCAETCDPGKTWEGLKSLRFLTLREIPTLSSLSFGDSVTILRELIIHSCQRLTSIDSIGKLTSLRRLMISKCNELKSLPKEMENLKSLKTLIILDCKLLLPRCQPETGDDWPHIRHITNKQVK